MPALKRLVISGIRNINEAEIFPSTGFNLIFGNNGSGKTSLLESIYLLSHGRSFRTHYQKPLLSEGMQEAAVYGETISGQAIGVSRSTNGPAQVKINGSKPAHLAELARELPLQLINTDAFKILEGSPKDRRGFLDWGVFHVKHQFLDAWRMGKRALNNRNALLKQGAKDSEIDPWTHEFVRHAEEIHKYRQEYIGLLAQTLESSMAGALLDEAIGRQVSLGYSCGWDEERGLEQQLKSNIGRERRYGHTLYGPHRADLSFNAMGKSCVDILSRGQAKLLITALKISQSQLLLNTTGKHSLFLIDDLPAELDKSNQNIVCKCLAGLGPQIFLTAIEKSALVDPPETERESKLFHVKHGKIQALDSPMAI